MTTPSRTFREEVAAAIGHTATYGTDPEFRRHWLGLTKESRNFRAEQLRVLGELLGSVTDTLAAWTILDVGCGDGRWLRTLLEFDAKPDDVVGIDISDVRFEIGRAKNPLITLLKTDGVTIPFADGTFDLTTQCVCFSNIPTFALRAHTAREMGRVLKAGGYIFWWDVSSSTAPTDAGARIDASDYFRWPIERRDTGEHVKPSETLRDFPGRRYVSSLVDQMATPATHTAALIGPKP